MFELTQNEIKMVTGAGPEELVAGAIAAWVMFGYGIGKDLAEGSNLQCKLPAP